MYIPIILGTAREGRYSEEAANFLLAQTKEANFNSEILDVRDYRIEATDATGELPQAKKLKEKIAKADGIIIVSPEYNGSYPGALKNVLDYLKSEYVKKSFGIVTVSSGQWGGVNASHHLQSWVMHVKGYPSPFKLMVQDVEDLFDENGIPHKQEFVRQADTFVDEFLWLTEAIINQKRIQSEN